MSRKAKQADLRRRMAEARSKLLQSQNPSLDDIEGSEDGAGNNVVSKSRKRPLSPGGGSGGILRKSKYTTTTDSAAKPNSFGALMDGYGESSSEDDDDNQNKSRAAVPSAATVKIAAAHPSQTTKMEESKHHYKPNNGNALSESISISKPAQAKEEAPISDEVWDEFNAILEADEEESNTAAANTTTTSTTNNNEKMDSTKSIENDKDTTQRDNEESPTSKDEVKLNDVKETNKDDLYDNDDTNTMEQTSYEARLARLILIKSKKKKKQTLEVNEVASESTDLPSASDFYDPSLAWAEEDEQEDAKVEKEISSEMDRTEGDGTTSSKQTTSAVMSGSSATVSMAKILRSRREEARIASRGEQVAGEGDLAEDVDTSDGQWF